MPVGRVRYIATAASGEAEYLDRPGSTKHFVAKWTEYLLRLKQQRSRLGPQFSEMATGQLSVCEAMLDDLRIVAGGGRLGPVRLRKTAVLPGQAPLWKGTP